MLKTYKTYVIKTKDYTVFLGASTEEEAKEVLILKEFRTEELVDFYTEPKIISLVKGIFYVDGI